MATIQLIEIHPAGSELFQDTESFLDELRDSDIGSVKGGLRTLGFEDFLVNCYGRDLNNGSSRYGRTVMSVQSNSFHNNTINGQSYNAVSATNYNTVRI